MASQKYLSSFLVASVLTSLQELYEPLWEDMLQLSEKAGFRIRSIWIADVSQQGQSGVLNEDKLGNDRMTIRFAPF